VCKLSTQHVNTVTARSGWFDPLPILIGDFETILSIFYFIFLVTESTKMTSLLTSDYPNPYENTDYSNYQDPYTVEHTNSYSYPTYVQNGFNDTEYNDGESYTSGESYGQNVDSDHSSRGGDQEDRDR